MPLITARCDLGGDRRLTLLRITRSRSWPLIDYARPAARPQSPSGTSHKRREVSPTPTKNEGGRPRRRRPAVGVGEDAKRTRPGLIDASVDFLNRGHRARTTRSPCLT